MSSRVTIWLSCVLLAGFAKAQPPERGTAPQKLRLYLIPGTGADQRLFDALDLSGYDTTHVRLPVGERGEDLPEYAARVARDQMDTTAPFAIVGVSLGGMVATELAEQLSPEHVVIIASAKTRHELPPGYRLARYVPLYRVVGGRTMRWFTKRFQPVVEPMATAQRELFVDMIYGKDPKFLQRAVGMMVRWDRTEAPPGITHVHGTEDRTLPYRHATPDLVVRDEGHMLTYSRPEVVEWVLRRELDER